MLGMNENPHPQTSCSTAPARQQFGLNAIFYLVAVYAVGLTFSAWTIVLTTLVLSGWLVLFKVKYGISLISLILFFVFLAGLFTGVQQIRSTPYWGALSLNKLRQVTLSIINYESGRRAFPPAYKTDDTGKPIHSWRVLMLPNLEEAALYATYDFDEPWDGPNNIKLLDQMPPIFACSKRDAPANLTPYKLVVGKGTPFEEGKPLSNADVQDGASNTFAVIEDMGNPVPWTKPEDLTIEQAITLLGGRGAGNVAHVENYTFSTREYGPSVSLLDGSTHMLGPRRDPDTIRDFCTRNDGRTVDLEMLKGSITVVRWDRYAALMAYIILLIAPGLVALKRTIAVRFQQA